LYLERGKIIYYRKVYLILEIYEKGDKIRYTLYGHSKVYSYQLGIAEELIKHSSCKLNCAADKISKAKCLTYTLINKLLIYILFDFLALQPTVVVFSQPGSGL
jgi:hypothetical protein